MNTPIDSPDRAYLLLSVVAQIWLAGYVIWSVRHGYISLRSERIYKAKNPARFRFILRAYIVVEIFLMAFTAYVAVKR